MYYIYVYDKSFEGLLTTLFDAYARKQFPDELRAEGEPLPLFCEATLTVRTDTEKADRVWRGLAKRLSPLALSVVAEVWLSEQPGADMLLFRYMRQAFDAPRSIELNMGDPVVLEVTKLWKKVRAERLRVVQFFRFQKAADGTYFAAVAPLYNVLPLVIPYALDRFADQRWLIYDVRRSYGFYYDLREATEVRFSDEDASRLSGLLDERIMDKDERLFQALWRAYFHATAIKERLNPRLQRQHMPVRFWQFMPEKQMMRLPL